MTAAKLSRAAADGETSNSRGDAELLKTVVSSLEEDIVLGRLHPRERLIEDELMRRFGVKRHVVRRGLADLERMGVVERVPNRGAMVRAYRADEIQKLYVLRHLLEGHAARSIPMPLARWMSRISRKLRSSMTRRWFAAISVWCFTPTSTSTSCCSRRPTNWYLADAIRQFALRTHGIRFYCLTYPGYLEKARRDIGR